MIVNCNNISQYYCIRYSYNYVFTLSNQISLGELKRLFTKHLKIYKYFLFKCNYFKFLVSSVHLFTHTECNVILFSHLNIIIFSVSTAPVPVWSTSGKPWKSWSRVSASTASTGRWSINETRSLQISERWRGNVVWCLSNRLQRGS